MRVVSIIATRNNSLVHSRFYADVTAMGDNVMEKIIYQVSATDGVDWETADFDIAKTALRKGFNESVEETKEFWWGGVRYYRKHLPKVATTRLFA
jgi:hypothetical protein